ncbi:ABC transporter substrate-binding protein [Paenibacillus amylolyticus]|uniref:ABC transporter substrate-binding protein n=1 Tax=Paenibacillus amylolyticus TaxID=1451 RepID=UPI003D975E5E
MSGVELVLGVSGEGEVGLEEGIHSIRPHDLLLIEKGQSPFLVNWGSTPLVCYIIQWRDEKIYDQYAKIAKTVLLPDRDNWRDELKDMGEALGKQKEAEQAIQDYDKRIATARDELKALVGDETFIYLRVMPKESYVMGELSSRGMVIHKELGLKTVAAYPENEGSVPVSLELLTEYQADHIILQIDGGDDNTNAQKLFDEMKESNIWKGMKAVKEDQVYLVGDKEWMNFGFSSVATLKAVDDIVSVIRERTH